MATTYYYFVGFKTEFAPFSQQLEGGSVFKMDKRPIQVSSIEELKVAIVEAYPELKGRGIVITTISYVGHDDD